MARKLMKGNEAIGEARDLARGLGLPRRPEAALRRLLAAAPRPLDAAAQDAFQGALARIVDADSFVLVVGDDHVVVRIDGHVFW